MLRGAEGNAGLVFRVNKPGPQADQTHEWPEATVVEPSSSWSDPCQYLRILAKWKGGTFTQPPLPEGKR